MIAKILIIVGFLFLLVWAGPWVIGVIQTMIESGEHIKDIVH